MLKTLLYMNWVEQFLQILPAAHLMFFHITEVLLHERLGTEEVSEEMENHSAASLL